ncbi:MAG TPA: potassium-transporting ATPase subunit C, partial [Acidisoma sp.]|nr:potassium-transporting ATPase subunit C [Acidisoma sp.]
MIREIRPALSLVVLFTIFLGLIMPGIFTEVSQAVFPVQAAGSLIIQNGQPVASAII